MDIKLARKIVSHVVKATKSRREKFDDSWYWDNIDKIFIRKGYEQGGFASFEFDKLLRRENISSISKVGSILAKYTGTKKYRRKYAGSLDATFYRELHNGKFGKEGLSFYECVKDFLEKKMGNPGGWFWIKLWQMLICCNYLRKNYEASFSYYLKRKYAEFKNLANISDFEFLDIEFEEWKQFKKIKTPWKELYGIGENVFDFILGDLKDARFASDSYKLDTSNKYFFKVTGIYKLLSGLSRENIKNFLKQLNLKYPIRIINTAIYCYCSETEAKNFGFCRNKRKCVECGVGDICEKNFNS